MELLLIYKEQDEASLESMAHTDYTVYSEHTI